MSKSIELSIIVPAFNEGHTIAEVLAGLKQKLDGKLTYEIIVVNDGSTDQTREIVEQTSGVTLINHKLNRGYSASLKTGIRQSQHEWILTFDGDGSHPAHQVLDLIQYCDDYDLIVGARVGKQAHDTFFRKTGRWLVTRFAHYISQAKIEDINSGFRLFRKDLALQFWHLFPEGFSFSTTLTVAAHVSHYAVKYLPVEIYRRKSGSSGIKPARDFVGFLNIVTRLAIYFRPLRVFMPLSALFLFLAIAIVLVNYFYIGDILDTTFAILVMASIQSLTFGVIAEMIVKRFYSSNGR